MQTVTNTKQISSYLLEPVKAAPLAVFRILFGLMMIFALVRFVSHGWVNEFYVEPQFHFKYYGFDWVQSLGNYTYILFVLGFLGALGIAIGFWYRLSCIVFFLCFTYVELIDKTTYLNHYYFVSLMAFLLIFIPANRYFSVDAFKNPKMASSYVPRMYPMVLKLMLAIVYFYAGLAKINSDWLLEAMPLKIWLPSKYNIPILGNPFQQEWMHYAMSWSGMLYDLAIPFLLFSKKTRKWAFLFVVFFHVLTRILFPIGIFPFVMIFSTLIFFQAPFHEKILDKIRKVFSLRTILTTAQKANSSTHNSKIILAFFTLFIIFQLVFPFRYLAYPGELFWTEEGYRFSWRVMLMEKAGYAQFKIVNPENGKSFFIDNSEFLTDFQQKQMHTQPDFMVEYAHFLAQHFQEKGIPNPEVYVESYVALNGRRSQSYIDPKVDLSKVQDNWKHKTWILPFKDKIYGF